MRLKTFLFSILWICAFYLPTPGISAEGEAFYQLLKVLRDKGALSDEEYNSLLNASREISNPEIGRIKETKKPFPEKANRDPQKLRITGNVRVRYQYNHLEECH